MEDRVLYFSPVDMSISYYLQMAENVVAEYENGREPLSANDFMELLHILRYVENNVYPKSWSDERVKFIESQNAKIARYFNSMTKESWVAAYRSLEFGYKESFFEAIDKYGAIDCLNDEGSLRAAISEGAGNLLYLLQVNRIVGKLDKLLTKLLKENKYTAEWLLRAYSEDSAYGRGRQLSFPSSLTVKDREQIVLDYISAPDANLNYVRLALVLKNVKGHLELSDKTRLIVRKRERELNDEILNGDHASTISLRYHVCMSDFDNVPVKWSDKDADGYPILCYSSKFLLSLSDEDLLHYYRRVYEMMSASGFINLVFKESESEVLERVIGLRGKHAYGTNMSFRFNETVSLMQTIAMASALKKVGRNIEEAVVWFFNVYLKKGFGYSSLPMKLSSQEAGWIEKIRNLLPEFESVAHQYQLYAENGDIDEELLQIASPFKYTDVKSAVENRYYAINGKPDELYRMFFIFFSDQSMLTFVDPHKKKHYSCFFDMLVNESEIPYNNYKEYQKRDLEYALTNGYIAVNDVGNVEISRPKEVLLLKQLYEYHACSYWAYDEDVRSILDEMKLKGWLFSDNHLLSEKERDYFSYYLNNEKFTNGPALRNRYEHGAIGSGVGDEYHKNAYFRLLNLLILYLLKIEEDLKMQKYLKQY